MKPSPPPGLQQLQAALNFNQISKFAMLIYYLHYLCYVTAIKGVLNVPTLITPRVPAAKLKYSRGLH